MSERTAFALQVPDDCRLASLTTCAAALGTTECTIRDLLVTEGVPLVELGARTRGVRVSDLRSLLKRRERAA